MHRLLYSRLYNNICIVNVFLYTSLLVQMVTVIRYKFKSWVVVVFSVGIILIIKTEFSAVNIACCCIVKAVIPQRSVTPFLRKRIIHALSFEPCPVVRIRSLRKRSLY